MVVLNGNATNEVGRSKTKDLFVVIGGVYEVTIAENLFNGEEVDISNLYSTKVYCGNMMVERLELFDNSRNGFVVNNLHMNTNSFKTGGVYTLTILATKTFSKGAVSKVKIDKLTFGAAPEKTCRDIVLSRAA